MKLVKTILISAILALLATVITSLMPRNDVNISDHCYQAHQKGLMIGCYETKNFGWPYANITQDMSGGNLLGTQSPKVRKKVDFGKTGWNFLVYFAVSGLAQLGAARAGELKNRRKM